MITTSFELLSVAMYPNAVSPNTSFVLYPSNVPNWVSNGGVSFEISISTKDLPEALSPVPAKALPSMADTERASPFFGKFIEENASSGSHQFPPPPAPSCTSPPALFTTVVPDCVPAKKSASVVCSHERLSRYRVTYIVFDNVPGRTPFHEIEIVIRFVDWSTVSTGFVVNVPEESRYAS